MGIMATHLKKQAASLPSYQPPPLWEDPRPDLQEDHHLWQRLLNLASNLPDKKEALEVTSVLHGMRCGGTMLVKGKSSYVIRPLIQPQMGWRSHEEYEADRERYLKPHAKLLKKLLLDLTTWMEKRGGN